MAASYQRQTEKKWGKKPVRNLVSTLKNLALIWYDNTNSDIEENTSVMTYKVVAIKSII